MKLLESFFDAIVRLEGDALIMHVGEKPYVVTTSSLGTYRGPLAWGQVELSSKPLSLEFVVEMLGQILSPEERRTLDDVGAVEHDVTPATLPDERFTIVVARGGDDIWVEVRRGSKEVPQPEPAVEPSIADAVALSEPSVPVAAVEAPTDLEEAPGEVAPDTLSPAIPAETPAAAESIQLSPEPSPPETLAAEEAEQPGQEEAPAIGLSPPADAPDVPLHAAAAVAEEAEEVSHETIIFEIPPDLEIPHDDEAAAPGSESSPAGWEVAAEDVFEIHAEDVSETATEGVPGIAAEDVQEIVSEDVHEIHAEDFYESTRPIAISEKRPPAAEKVSTVAEAATEQAESPAATSARPVIVRIARPTAQLKPPPAVTAQSRDPLPIEQLIRAAVDAGGSVVYLVAESRPVVRAAGHMRVLKSQPVVTAASIEQFVLEFAPVREPLASDTDALEWEFQVAGVGRIRCAAFHDRNGLGLILHLIPVDVSTLEQLGVPAGIHEFSDEVDGLVIVAGPRASGKSTLLHALVDRINRTRFDHVVTIESRIGCVHEPRNSLISQREVSGDGEEIAAAARAALREGPDVLVIDDLRSPDAIAVAIDAARAGRLILGSIAAPSSTAAVERLIDVFTPVRRAQVRALLAGILRGVITQALVRDKTGTRIAARELLLSSPAVRQLITDGELSRLDTAIEAGRAHGMVTLSSILLALVRDDHVDVAEARRHAPDREEFTSMLRRAGLQVPDGERLA